MIGLSFFNEHRIIEKDFEASESLFSMDQNHPQPQQSTGILFYVDLTLSILQWLIIPISSLVYVALAHSTTCNNPVLAKCLLALVGGWISCAIKLVTESMIIDKFFEQNAEIHSFLNRQFNIGCALFSGVAIGVALQWVY
jgi:hypothetical protein